MVRYIKSLILIVVSATVLSGCILPPLNGNGNNGYYPSSGRTSMWCLNHNRRCRRHHHNLWCKTNNRCGYNNRIATGGYLGVQVG